MSATKPFGNPNRAKILIIGHDPRLQQYKAEAGTVFFMDLLWNPEPTYGPERSKYRLAHAVWDYISYLADRRVDLGEIYATNLCNEFLEHIPNSGTVFIPKDKAHQGIAEIKNTISKGHFRVILPMAVQPFYYLCESGFIEEKDSIINNFLLTAAPNTNKSSIGIYIPIGKAPFLSVCGKRFHHKKIPVIPVLHVKQWPIKGRTMAYLPLIENAKNVISIILAGQHEQE